MGLKIFLNGALVEKEKAVVSVFDHGLLYGDGVFEGIRSYNRKVFRLDEHLDRLYQGAKVIRLDVPYTKEELRDHILDTLKANDLNDAYIRVVVTRGVGDLGLDPRKCKKATVFIITDKITLYPESFYENGLPIIIAGVRRNHPSSIDPRVKSLNYLNNILGKIDAIDAGTMEALMLSIDGYVVECTGDNIFTVKDGVLSTPPSEMGALAGITQKAVMELASSLGISTGFREMKPETLYNAEECFLTGTAAEIIPVVKIGDKVIGDGKPGQVTKDLRAAYHDLTGKEGTIY
ncbi:MAG: branched-chain-amino-acid transaminase [Candidatus Omnitrophica bacterium]|nr:branched-chain-amino-acid transaminase [Candidatus Omnitrophota bacterium]MDD5487656.1 branched-chain-amino-acid transaminase [Candidatus Omnitrophota bacterium]